MRTVVVQSHRSPLPYEWLHSCIDSVKQWAQIKRFDYVWMGDELFDELSPAQRANTKLQRVVASDLARLHKLTRELANGADRVVWCDADTLVINPEALELPVSGCALGREIWIQPSTVDGGTPKVYAKVHNALMVFCKGDSFLPFYRDTASRLLERHAGPYVDQFIGPKLLTALHNLVQLPVLENAGVLSPGVVIDINRGGGVFLDTYCRRLQRVPAALNLCASSVRSGELSEQSMSDVIDVLQRDGTGLFIA